MSLVSRILHLLDANPVNTNESFPDESLASIQAAVRSLVDKNMITAETVQHDVWTLSNEGQDVAQNGSYEYRLYKQVLEMQGLSIAEVPKLFGPSGKQGQMKAFKNGWIKNEGDLLVKTDAQVSEDATQKQLQKIQNNENIDPKDLAELKKRKLVQKSKSTFFKLSKGPEFALEVAKLETDLTVELVQSGAYKNAKFKPYNLESQGTHPHGGALHPLNKVRAEFRDLFFAMGFTEMATDPYVETGFWNFDALFVPQQHPARDLQDTFYIKDPIEGKLPDDKTYFEHIRNVHQNGEFGSLGYRYPWKEDEAKKLVLRTHTTAVSARVLHELAKNPRPARYFSIDRVFRNEAVDATHLAEFHQIEGVIADYGLTLGDLIGFMKVFFGRMGVHELRFKPAYNPYTEPSLEIFGYHNKLAKWVEIGNSGLFRPEMLLSMGLPESMRVIGFGLSLERPTMIKYGVSNIRELLGHKVSLDFIQSNPAVRFDESLV